jgi:RNA polymerase sigma factor (sigma-70 family)
MPHGSLSAIVEYIRQIGRRGPAAVSTDGQLLERFIAQRDEEAFSALVQRHGPLVLTVCRRLLHNYHDVEDAFQATFLVLVRKAGSIAKRESAASWLHGVAHRTALRAKTAIARRTALEKQTTPLSAPDCMQEVILHDLRLILDEEVQRLPERYRLPFVLCYMEGKTNEEAAALLGCPKGTVLSRLSRAREKLRGRLSRRGLGLSAGLIPTMLSQSAVSAAVPASLAEATAKAAMAFAAGQAATAAVVSAHVVALTERVLNSMFINKFKEVAAMLLVLGIFGTGAAALIHQALSEKKVDQKQQHAPEPATKNSTKPTDDRAKMQGTWESWETVNETVNGVAKPPRKRKITWVITDDKIVHGGEDGFLQDEWTFKLDATKSPKTIDLSNRRDGTLLGIYLLQGDSLKIRLGFEDKRPTEIAEFPDFSWDLKRVSRESVRIPQRFANAPGCFWIQEPTKPSPMMSMGLRTMGLSCIYEKGADGAVLITLACLAADMQAAGEHRPILLDAAQKRYLPELSSGGGAGFRGAGMVLNRWRMDPKVLPAEKVVLMGIEALTTEAHRIAAAEALEQAKKAHIEVLPWPTLDQAYSFTLSTVGGRKIRSKDQKGKVVLLDFWTCG